MSDNIIDEIIKNDIEGTAGGVVGCGDGGVGCVGGVGGGVLSLDEEAQQQEIDSGEEGVSTMTITFLVLLFYPIAKIFLQEYALARRKMRDKRIQFEWQDQLQYRLDFYLSRSESSKVLLLLIITYLLVLVGAIMLQMITGLSLATSTWMAWTYIADPGTHADADGDLARIVSLVITIGGMLIFALMIGIMSDSIGQFVDQLKSGVSRIIESDHTLILGWSDKTLAIIQQIALANESEGGGIVVVLADMSKAEMESLLITAVEAREDPLRLLGTIVVFREGNPLLEASLERVSVRTARSIIALSTSAGNEKGRYYDENPDEADSRMVRQVLSLKAIGKELPCHVVVEVQDIDNKHLVELVAPEFVEVIVAHDVIGRLMIQCARQPGLAYVLESLLGFDGDEFYLESWDSLTNKTFYEITCRFDEAIPVGVRIARTGEIKINPEDSYVIQKGDEILVLAEDNDTYTVNDGEYKIHGIGRVPANKEEESKKETLLFCGWRRDMADMIKQLDEYVQKGSELWLFNLVPVEEREELFLDKGNKDPIKTENLSLMNAFGNQMLRGDLKLIEALDYTGKKTGRRITLDMFDSILILADALAMENGADMQSTDSRSLASLLIIQDIQRKNWEVIQKALDESRNKNGTTEFELNSLNNQQLHHHRHHHHSNQSTTTDNHSTTSSNHSNRSAGALSFTMKKGHKSIRKMFSKKSRRKKKWHEKSIYQNNNGSENNGGGENNGGENRIELFSLSREGEDSSNVFSLDNISIIEEENSEEFRRNGPAILEKRLRDRKPCYPISEILDTRTRSLLKVADCKGYIMSNQIVSSLMAQVSEDRSMNTVLSELLSAEGCESYIRDVSIYVDVDKEEPKSFWDVALRARQKREVLVGYKLKECTFTEASDTILNPPEKSKRRRWRKGDMMIIFAFD